MKKIRFLAAALALAAFPAFGQNVKITPIGSHPGELCANDRAMVFEDPTGVRILYDDHAIYFGVRMEDTHPPTALLQRRDTFGDTDFLSINLDAQLDRLSGN